MGRKRAGRPLEKPRNPHPNCESGNESQDQGQDLDQSWVDSVRQQIIAWYEEAQRDFPWRRGNDPYRILVSEMMLVQTTVAAVIPYFERFLHRFPDLQTLASADEADVLRVWEGLGYYRRARQLQAAARMIVDTPCGRDAPRAGGRAGFAGRWPLRLRRDRVVCLRSARTDFGGELATSPRAVAGLAGRPEEVCVSDPSLGGRRTACACSWSRQVQPGAHGLGRLWFALRARPPACSVPGFALAARRLGIQDSVPVVAPRPRPLAVTEACALVMHEGAVLVVQRNDAGLWARFWEFPTINLGGADPRDGPLVLP